MSEEKKKLTLGSKTLTLKKPPSITGDGAKGASSVTVEVVGRKRRKAEPKTDTEKTAQTNDDGLTADEREARLKALKHAAERDEKEEKEQKEQAERINEKKRIEAERKAKEEAAQKVQQEAAALVQPIKQSERVAAPTTAHQKQRTDDEEKRSTPKKSKVLQEKKSRGKLTITNALSGNEERMRSVASMKRAAAKKRRSGEDNAPKEKIYREVVVPETITVQELANRMTERAVDVTKTLMKMGMMATANQTIDADTAELVIEEFGHSIKRVTEADVENAILDTIEDTEDQLQSRPPVVTFMGHVDHGKTSLLDAIRKTHIADKEAGGITQHIGAYQVQTTNKDLITFLDTPGHEAFTAMRQRGATATDLVVLVVAADDGVMAQTIEALNHAKAAEVPIIVAINKIDKPGADIQKVRTSLLEHELVPEEFGGDTLVIDVSAKEGTGLDQLLDAIMLQSEILELKANPDRRAEGTVVEASMHKSKGVIATLLVEKGTLKHGDLVVAGTTYGRIRAMNSAEGKTQKSALPACPVSVLGFENAPAAGDRFVVVEQEKQARDIVESRANRERELKAAQHKRSSLEELFLQNTEDRLRELPIIIKSDVQGSAEAIIGSLEKLATAEVSIKVLHHATGGISTSDIALASASGALVVGFNVRADGSAKELAETDNIDIRYYSIIYDLIDDVKAILSGMLKPTIRENYLGTADIREVFTMSKYGKVAGCFVTDGMIKRGAKVRLLRDNVVIHEGTLKTLKRFKDDVAEVQNNFECGMAFENYEDIKEGDKIEAFELVEEERQL